MKSFIAITAVVVALACPITSASAGERENDAALGAGSGLLVGGPVGLVAGGVIGYVAGPEFGAAWASIITARISAACIATTITSIGSRTFQS